MLDVKRLSPPSAAEPSSACESLPGSQGRRWHARTPEEKKELGSVWVPAQPPVQWLLRLSQAIG